MEYFFLLFIQVYTLFTFSAGFAIMFRVLFFLFTGNLHANHPIDFTTFSIPLMAANFHVLRIYRYMKFNDQDDST